MSKMEIELRDKGAGSLKLRYQIRDTGTARKWTDLLRCKLDSSAPFQERPALFKAFTAAGRTADAIWRDIQSVCHRLKAFPGTHLPENFETLNMSQENLSLLHKSFEVMRGETDERTKFYSASPRHIQLDVDALNEKIQEAEAAVGFSDGVGGILQVNLRDQSRIELDDEDRKQFSMSRGFGDAYLRYAQVRKPDNIRPLQYCNGEFDITFRDGSFRASTEYLNPLAPSLCLGWITVATLERDGDLKGLSEYEICREVALRQSLAGIRIFNN